MKSAFYVDILLDVYVISKDATVFTVLSGCEDNSVKYYMLLIREVLSKDTKIIFFIKDTFIINLH